MSTANHQSNRKANAGSRRVSTSSYSGDQELDQCKLYITSIPVSFDDEQLRVAVSVVAPPTYVFVYKHPNAKHTWGFAGFDDPDIASLVKDKLHLAPPHNFRIRYAKHTEKNKAAGKPRKSHLNSQSLSPSSSSLDSDFDRRDAVKKQTSHQLENGNGTVLPKGKSQKNHQSSQKSKETESFDQVQKPNIFDSTQSTDHERSYIKTVQVPLKVDYNKACEYVHKQVFGEGRVFSHPVQSRACCHLCGKASRFECFSCSVSYCHVKCANADNHKASCKGASGDSASPAKPNGAAATPCDDIKWTPFSKKQAPPEIHPPPKRSHLPSAKDTSKQNLCPIPFGRYSDIAVLIALGNFEYWVVSSEDLDTHSEVMNQLETLHLSESESFSPQPSELCAALYDELWNRAQVIEKGAKYKVKFIDFGNVEECSPESLRKLPAELLSIKPLAFKVVLDEGTSTDFKEIAEGDSISVKPVMIKGDSWLVQVEGQVYEKKILAKKDESPVKSKEQTSVSVAARKSVFPLHIYHMIKDEGFNFKLRVNRVGEREVTGTLIVSGLEQSSNHEIESELKKLEPTERSVPALGQPVCCVTDNKGLWARGYAVSHAPVRVALVDYGVVAAASRFCPLSPALQGVAQAGVRCSWDKPRKLKKGELLYGRGTSRLPNCLKVKVEGVGEASLVPWDPQADPDGLIPVSLPSASPVFISEVVSPSVVYLRSAAPDAVQVFNSVNAKTALCAKEPPLDREPLLGEVLGCLYQEDDCFYRAQITKVHPESFTVTYIDFGNTGVVSRADLRQLDTQEKLAPCMAVRVGLKHPNPELFADTKYTIYHDGDLSCVTLSQAGSSPPVTAPPEAAPTGNSLIKYVYWPEGQPISIEMESRVAPNIYRAVRLDDHLEYVKTTLRTRLGAYANKFPPGFRHSPSDNEVVVVRRGDGEWWRGVCIEKRVGSGCKVRLLDRGQEEEVDLSDVRPCKEELLRAAVVLREAVLHGVPEALEPSVDDALQRFLLEAPSVEAIVVDDCVSGRAVLYLPALLAKASIIGLPPITPPLSI